MASHGKTSRLRIYDFRHRGNTYEVCLEELDGQRFTGVYGPNGIKRLLVPFPEEIPTGQSPRDGLSIVTPVPLTAPVLPFSSSGGAECYRRDMGHGTTP